MKLLIVGSRSINEFDFSKYVPEETTMIITGGANGVDTLAEKFAGKKRLSKLIMRPRHDLYGKSAPLKRNEKMVEICDLALIIWDGNSKGTKYTINYAEWNFIQSYLTFLVKLHKICARTADVTSFPI